VPFAIVLAREGFAADRAYEWSFVGVGTQMRPQVIRPGELLRAQSTLEGGGVFLDTAAASGRA
jgi:hypothetical protein